MRLFFLFPKHLPSDSLLASLFVLEAENYSLDSFSFVLLAPECNDLGGRPRLFLLASFADNWCFDD